MMNDMNKHAYKMQHWKRQLFYFNCGVFSLLSTHIRLLDFLPFFFEHSPIFPQDINSSPSSSSTSSSANTWNCVPRALPWHGPKLAGVGVSEPSTLLPSVKMYIFTFQIFQAKKVCALLDYFPNHLTVTSQWSKNKGVSALWDSISILSLIITWPCQKMTLLLLRFD